jgi:hypothetical protein
VPENRDTLLSIKAFTVSVKVMPIVFGKVKLADVILRDGHLNLTNKKGVKNFDFLFKKKKDTTETKTKANLADLADNLINQLLYKIPDNLDLKNFALTYTTDSSRMSLLTQSAVIKDGKLMSTISVNNGAATWHMAGIMHPSDKNIDVKLYADRGKVILPEVKKGFRLKLSFDTITTRLNKVDHSGDETRIYGYWSVRNLTINHPALSADDIIVPSSSIDANVFVGTNYVSIDSSSVIHLKKLVIVPFIKYKLSPVKMYTVKAHTDWLNAQDVFDSFPQGVFESLEGIKVAGKLRYRLHAFLDTSNPDDVQFESGLDKQDFKVLSYGKADLGKLNRPFTYIPYEFGKPMPARVIGPQNPDYTPLSEISINVRNAVMTSEDPSFYTNRGFVEESLRRSIAVDFKEKKFKRGGSTISMQLIKNAFLSRQKTLSRKIEEILIVWVIENAHLMSKDRMLEVYFNIVEWGRNIYGIGEAAHYYFGKSPSELSLGDGIFLASILPSPKAGLYAFMPDGSLRPGLHGYFNLIGRLMASKGLTDRDTSAYGFYEVRLKPSLRRGIMPVDTAVADSIIKHSDEDDAPMVVEPEKKPNFFQRLFGKHDTTKKVPTIDTSGKTKEQLQAEKKEKKRLEKELRKANRERGY